MKQLRVACRSYDRTLALETGRVEVRGAQLTFISMRPNDTLTHQLATPDFELSEMSMSAHMIASARGDAPFVALPIFISRKFRHGNIYLAPQRAGVRPEDLVGMRVGVPQYHSTAAVWIRGMLQDDYGVAASDLRWVRGGLSQPGMPERIALDLPSSIELTDESTRSLNELLRAGELDALFTAIRPPVIDDPRTGVTRLFPDPVSASRDYYARTGFFPIMHCMALRRDVYEDAPDLVPALMDAFEQSRQLAMAELAFSGSAISMLPWEEEWFAQSRDALGDDYWRYGVERSRHELEAMLRYLSDQGLTRRVAHIDEVFPPEAIEHERRINMNGGTA